MMYSRLIFFFPVFALYFAIECVTSDLWVIAVFNYTFFMLLLIWHIFNGIGQGIAFVP